MFLWVNLISNQIFINFQSDFYMALIYTLFQHFGVGKIFFGFDEYTV